MITIGHLARTYGKFPHEVVESATTFDIMIDDVYATWEKSQYMDQQQPTSYSPTQLKEILDKSRAGRQ